MGEKEKKWWERKTKKEIENVINSEEEKYTKVEERGRGWNLGYYGILVRGKGDGRKDKYEGREGRWAEGNWQTVKIYHNALKELLPHITWLAFGSN